MVELKRVRTVEVIDGRHCVPFDTVAVKPLDAFHHLEKRGAAVTGAAVCVVIFFGAVEREADKEVVLLEKFGPVAGDKGAVGLDRVADGVSVGILFLEFKRLLVERNRAHERFATMPREQDFGRGLHGDIVAREAFEQLIAHDVAWIVGVELGLFEIVTVVASHVAKCACRLRHDIKRPGERIGCLLCHVGRYGKCSGSE